MPIDFEIDTERRIVHSRAHGVVRDEDMLAHQRALAADPSFEADLDQLLEDVGVKKFDVQTATFRQLASKNPFSTGSRRAIVAPGDAGFGLSRMFEMLTEPSGNEVRVFRSVDQAREWLKLEPGKA